MFTVSPWWAVALSGVMLEPLTWNWNSTCWVGVLLPPHAARVSRTAAATAGTAGPNGTALRDMRRISSTADGRVRRDTGGAGSTRPPPREDRVSRRPHPPADRGATRDPRGWDTARRRWGARGGAGAR